ncbi:Rho1 guanine nucleotide exchange factor 1 [Trametes pubescens]|uniref:Rho1 guanine nucleotide exchange factor 1 n=1 Tax=Trametes pubescens TaxID=154538 RepID=A0A1M2VVC1_TRAPU|nr:Rho1 guanine nucleotide exchange factor 1 [Trametes pubescens]
MARGESRPPSFVGTPEAAVRDLSSELSDLTLDSEEGLRKFQRGEIYDDDLEWYRLVPPEARQVLSSSEVQRQSILFEIIKSEKDYVSDLETLQEVFIEPIVNTLAVPEFRVRGFIQEVFFNLDKILEHHKRMLGALFERQRDQHPLIQSLSDIILDNSLLFQDDYEDYIKHYPLAEARHRSELRRNSRYQYLLQQCSLAPRVRKRDLITFLSRPVTRLPRLLLLLENAKKYTEPDHPDMETIPLLIGILKDFIRSTQPGIAASEDKVKYWNLCESLIYQKGEIIDLDLYDESRSLRFQGPLSRRYKSNMDLHWADLHVALLDNYMLLLKPEARSSTVMKHHVVSRPIPLEYLRLGAFDGPPENRKEKAEDGSGILDRVRSRYRQMYPFTIYHASSKMSRRYTLYAGSEAARQKWYDALDEALGIRQVRQESNMLFAPHIINEGFFKHAALVAPYGLAAHYTGRVNAATELSFRKVLSVPNPTSMVALPAAGKLFVLHEDGLCSYSLDMLARAALGLIDSRKVDASRETIAGDVLFFRAGRVGNRFMVLYGQKSFLQVYLYALEVVSNADANHPRWSTSGVSSFRSFGDPLVIPKDTYNITVLSRRIVICSEKGISVADPANLSLGVKSTHLPDFSGSDLSLPMAGLKVRCAACKPLGIVRCPNSEELLVVYDELGCYMDKHGVPTRASGYLRWETKAVSYAHRGDYLMLISPEFIEVRTVHTGKLVQVLEGADMRRIDVGLLSPDKDSAQGTTLIAMRGREEQGLVADRILELVETSELRTPRVSDVPGQWEDFDIL